MSVVNKMLSDLENRPHQAPKTANYVPPKSRKLFWTGIVVSAVFSVSIAFTTFVDTSANIPAPVERTEEILYDPNKGDQFAHTPTTEITNANLDRHPNTNLDRHSNIDNKHQDNKLFANQDAQHRSATSTTKHEPVETKSVVMSEAQQAAKATKPLSTLNIQASDGAKGRLSQLRAQAHHASEKGDEQAVIATLHEIIDLAPEDLRTRKQLAAMLFSKQQLQAALQVLQQALIQAPADSSSRLMMARIYYKTNKHNTALDILKAHPHYSLANDELLSFRAALAESLEEYEIAQHDYQLLVDRNPSEAKWWLGLGVSQDKQMLGPQAIASYEQAKSLNQLPQQVDSFVEQRIRLLARR